jgi:hypothetical protein
MNADYYKTTAIRSHTPENDTMKIDDANYYMKYASACFGWKYLYGILHPRAGGLFQGVTGGDSTNVSALCEHCKIAQEDVLVAQWTSTHHDPGHFLALDHARSALVLAIRGKWRFLFFCFITLVCFIIRLFGVL